MKILDFRKYFFANISALWSMVVIYSIIANSNTHYPPPGPNDAIASGGIEFFVMCYCIIIFLCLLILTFLEICIRKYIIEKKFPGFKLNIKTTIPKIFINIYNIIFSIGFTLACILFVTGLVIAILTIFDLIFS